MNICTVREKYPTAHAIWMWLFHIIILHLILIGVFTESELCGIWKYSWALTDLTILA